MPMVYLTTSGWLSDQLIPKITNKYQPYWAPLQLARKLPQLASLVPHCGKDRVDFKSTKGSKPNHYDSNNLHHSCGSTSSKDSRQTRMFYTEAIECLID